MRMTNNKITWRYLFKIHKPEPYSKHPIWTWKLTLHFSNDYWLYLNIPSLIITPIIYEIVTNF